MQAAQTAKFAYELLLELRVKVLFNGTVVPVILHPLRFTKSLIRLLVNLSTNDHLNWFNSIQYWCCSCHRSVLQIRELLQYVFSRKRKSKDCQHTQIPHIIRNTCRNNAGLLIRLGSYVYVFCYVRVAISPYYLQINASTTYYMQ